MTRLSFYGGINEIGGNKILLEDEGGRLFLDFGFPYKRHKLFYEEYLKPRGGAGLLDPLAMGLIPLIEGIYRDDLAGPGLWNAFQPHPLYRHIEHVDGVLLSHAHIDHSGHISFLKSDIPVYSTAVTAFVTKAIQDSGKSDFDTQVCYFSPTIYGCPTGWRQNALLSAGSSKQQRRFCLPDGQLQSLTPEGQQFWASGFWEKSSRQKEMASCPLTGHNGKHFNLRCFPVDHSIPGACSWGIETSAGWIIYSGDIRLHGKHPELTRKFIEDAAKLHPKALILEGTNVRRERNIYEEEVYQNGLKAISGTKSLVIADFSPRDVDRLLTFRQIAIETNRKLAILPKDAYLLKTLRLLDPSIPDIAQDSCLVIYQDTTANRNPMTWMRNIFEDYDQKTVLAKDVSAEQDRFILCFSFFDLNELPSINCKPGSLYVYSSSEPHDEEQEIDFRRLHNWLERFGINSFGLPVEKGDKWEIPEEERGLHASGHACGTDLLQIVNEIRPEILLPVHSEYPAFYQERLPNNGIKVILPELNGTIEIR